MMGGVCYQKGQERGLWYEIKCIQEVVDNKTARGEDCKFEKKLLKAYKQLNEIDYASAQNQNLGA